MNSSMVTSFQDRPQNISFLRRPKKPSQAELSGEQPFFDIDLVRPAFSILSIQPGQRQCAPRSELSRIRDNSDRGSQYTSAIFRSALNQYGIVQSMNSDGGRCHDNARCEAMWARMKEELLYGRYNTREMMVEDLKTLIWRYFIIYWNNRRICTANGGLPPMVKRQRYYESLQQAA